MDSRTVVMEVEIR